MMLLDTQVPVSEVLRAFHHDEPYLFLGAAFTTVGLVSAAFCLLRRRFDALLVWMAIFAILYGLRSWLDADLLRLSMPNNELFERVRFAVSLLIPVPAFIFFREAGFLGERIRSLVFLFCAPFPILVGATFLFGPLPLFHNINNGLVIAALVSIVIRSLRRGSDDRDFVVVRRGLLCFAAFALWDNTLGSFWGRSRMEPFGFAALLGCLGYVAARRMMARDLQLGEIQKEMELARRIQLSLLPAAFPDSAAFRVAAKYVPMTAVAGDLYDFLVADGRRAGLLIADVSGHGVPAALIASMVKMAATSQRASAAHPGPMLSGMNAALCGNTQGQYVTAAYVYLDAETRSLRYAAAGHPEMMLLRGGVVTEIAENGMLLAAVDGVAYSEKTVPIEPGDRLLLYTDGLTEARSGTGALFGEDALKAALRQSVGLSPAEAAEQIIAKVQGWARLQDDDLTVLVCDFLSEASKA